MRSAPGPARGCAGRSVEPQLGRVLVPVELPVLHHAVYVAARLGERDVVCGIEVPVAARLLHPPVDVRETRVVGGYGKRLVAVVTVDQVAQIPGPVGDVDL